MRTIDLRSDTVTLPTKEMLEYMISVPLGDDGRAKGSKGEDPTAVEAETYVAEVFGKEDALFVPSGSMGNMVCVATHCKRGEKAVTAKNMHMYKAEKGIFSEALCGVLPVCLPHTKGVYDLAELEKTLQGGDIKLVCLENTYNFEGGCVISREDIEKIQLWKEEPSYYGGDILHQAKKEKIQKAMEENGLDAILLLKAETVRYATDFYVKGYRPFYEPEYLAVIPKGQDTIVGHTSGSDNYRIQIRSDIKDHRKLPGFSKWGDEVIKIFRDYGITGGRVGVELLPFQMYLQLKAEFPTMEFVDISQMWVDLTVVKHPEEIKHLRRAVQIACVGCNAALEFVKPGVKEYEVAAYAEYKMRKLGSEMTPFVTNIASGVNSAIFERISTEKVIGENEMVIIDLGSVYRGYTGDVGRSKCTGKPTDLQKQMYKANYYAMQEALKAVKPGNTCGDIDAAARRAIKEMGFEKYEHKFATGHQLGYGLHGSPSINRGVDYVLRPGMVMAVEPRVTMFDHPEVGGTHMEQNILVTEDGYELLSTDLPFDEDLLAD